MRLRKWVKITLAIIFILGIIILDYKWTKKEVDDCINKGINENICEELWK